MELQVRNSLIAALLVMTTSARLAASVSLVKKEPVASSTKFNYLYNYTCRNNVKGCCRLRAQQMTRRINWLKTRLCESVKSN
jgi:hypothetical protein